MQKQKQYHILGNKHQNYIVFFVILKNISHRKIKNN